MKRSISTILATVLISALPLAASAQVSIGVAVGGPGWGVGIAAGYPPPAIPAYSIPPAPYPNWQLVPGYWAWGSYGYYWVPAYWTAPPVMGYYWTPGYWGYTGGVYAWTPGYWGPTVGFYGGINYGFGYFGSGFVGGFWAGPVFNYNTAIVPVNRTVIHNVYNKTVINKTVMRGSHVAFNGGRGGVRARPTRAQVLARRNGMRATAVQRAHILEAARDRALAARVNHGHPRMAAVQKPLTVAHHNGTTRVAHGRVSAATHHHASTVATHHHAASTASHHGQVAATHHNAPTTATHHSASMTASHHASMAAAPHHHATMAAAPHHHATMAAAPHHHATMAAAPRARPANGGFARGSTFGRPPGGGLHSSGGFRGPGGGMSGGGGRGNGGGRPPKS